LESINLADGGARTRHPDAGGRLYVGEQDGVWIASVRTMYEALESVGADVEIEILAGEGGFLGSLAGAGLMSRLEGLRQP